MATYLDRILEFHRARATADNRSTDRLLEEVGELEPARGFAAALRGGPTLRVISEVKRRSPSKGDLAPGLDPSTLAATYAAAGASALSVLTDEAHFGGAPGDLVAARAAVDIPVLRKDFTVCANDVLDARAMGADAVLLIVSALSDAELAQFDALAAQVGLDALVEVHDEAELARAVATTRCEIVGVNQRDLFTFEVDQQRAVRLAASIPPHAVSVAESGVRGHDDAVALAAADYDAVLVGEHLVTAQDVSSALTELLVPRG